MNERTKLIIVAVLAFFFGGFLNRGGSPSNGRYQACGNSITYILDTEKGVTWESRNGRYEKVASIPW